MVKGLRIGSHWDWFGCDHVKRTCRFVSVLALLVQHRFLLYQYEYVYIC